MRAFRAWVGGGRAFCPTKGVPTGAGGPLSFVWGNPDPCPNDTRGAPPRRSPDVPIFWPRAARHAPRLLIASREFRRGASRAILSRVPFVGRFCNFLCKIPTPLGLWPPRTQCPAPKKVCAGSGPRAARQAGACRKKMNIGNFLRPRREFSFVEKNWALRTRHYCR